MICVVYDQFFVVLQDARGFTVPGLGSGFETTGISFRISRGRMFQEFRTLDHYSGANNKFA